MKRFVISAPLGLFASFFVMSAAPAADMLMRVPDVVASPQLIGAKPAPPSDWPATLIFTIPGGGCTSTAIGPRVLLTAAHCVEDGQKGTVSINKNGTLIAERSVKCTHHPGYAENYTLDFALCLVDDTLSGTIPAFERVNVNPSNIQAQTKVTLLGFGCTKEGGVDGSFGQLFVGDATVKKRPSGTDNYYYALGGAALCYGDSGGAAYYTQPGRTSRLIIGINSRGDISSRSYLASTSNMAFLDWAYSWATTNAADICGLSETTEGCRE